ncbi:MAG: hypothetical protein JXK16_01140 [Thiotrichales bacterium]|nr:hypothetical protein [Thiotrichales bacterium]
MNNSILLNVFLALFILSATGCSTSQQKPQQEPEAVVEAISEAETLAETDEGNGFGGTGRMQTQVAKKVEPINRALLRHSTVLDNGFGGTGQTASGFGGTGFIGTLEQFGSIWVNGIEVGLGQKTLILSNIESLSEGLTAQDLRIGQQVWFETLPNQDKTTTAVIHVFYPLAGKIESVQTLDMVTELVVNGQRVYLSSETVIPENIQLKVGESVRISGLPVYAITLADKAQAVDLGQGVLKRSNAWQATLIEQSMAGEVWSTSVPNVRFSDQVNRLIMHPSWSSSYQMGEFPHLPKGLGANPIIEVVGDKSVTPQNK